MAKLSILTSMAQVLFGNKLSFPSTDVNKPHSSPVHIVLWIRSEAQKITLRPESNISTIDTNITDR